MRVVEEGHAYLANSAVRRPLGSKVYEPTVTDRGRCRILINALSDYWQPVQWLGPFGRRSPLLNHHESGLGRCGFHIFTRSGYEPSVGSIIGINTEPTWVGRLANFVTLHINFSVGLARQIHRLER